MGTAGIDFGSTLVKAYWRADGKEHYAAVSHEDQRTLALQLHHDGVRRARCTGIGKPTGFSGLGIALDRARDGAVDDEIQVQAAGARLLMGKAPRKLIIAAIGTGVSYTVAKGRRAKRHPLGSCHGGGTILGLAEWIGARDFRELEAGAAVGNPCDLLVKDKLPETAGTPLGDLVIAHFFRKGASFEDKCASIFSFAAVSIIKDLAILTSIPFSPKDIAVVGTVSESPLFRGYLMRWAPMLKGCRLHFPARGGFAAAVGAWADIST